MYHLQGVDRGGQRRTETGADQATAITHYQPSGRGAGRADSAADSAHTTTPTPRVSPPTLRWRAAAGGGEIPSVENFIRKTKWDNALSRHYAIGRYLSVV